jgi:hypothetical protein
MPSVNGVTSVYERIPQSLQVPASGSTISLRAKAPIPYAAEADQLDGAESFSSLYDIHSLQTVYSGGRSPSHDPPREFGKKNGLRQDRQMPPERLSPHHTDSAAAEEAQQPGADFSSTGPAYAQEVAARAKFARGGGFSGIKIRTDAPKPNTSEASTSNPRVEFRTEKPKIEFGPEQFAQALTFLNVVGHVATVAWRGLAVPESFSGAARTASTNAQPRLYNGEGGVFQRPPAEITLTA